MNYNEEMFLQTLKAADLSIVTFKQPIQYDETIIKYGETYINALLEDPEPAKRCAGDAERYYYMLASHALYAAFCMANWEKLGQPKDSSLRAVMVTDALIIMQTNWKTINTEEVNWYVSDVYDMAINDFHNKYGQEYKIDNANKYIYGLLMAFFVVGYNLLPEYFG